MAAEPPEDSTSHTSVNTIPSESRERDRKVSVSSTASSYSSTASSYTSYSESEPNTPRAKTPTQTQVLPHSRKDDFFDQSVPEKDYASVIESMTDGRENDFPQTTTTPTDHDPDSIHVRPDSGKHDPNTTVTLTLHKVQEENKTIVFPRDEVEACQERSDSEPDTARIMVDDDTDLSSRQAEPQAEPQAVFMDGFKVDYT